MCSAAGADAKRCAKILFSAVVVVTSFVYKSNSGFSLVHTRFLIAARINRQVHDIECKNETDCFHEANIRSLVVQRVCIRRKCWSNVKAQLIFCF